MTIDQIKAELQKPASEAGLQAIPQLKHYEPAIAVPILLNLVQNPDFLVRSLTAMALGKQLTAESFAALLAMVKFDRDPNVRAEAVNSLSMFGEAASAHLSSAFLQDDHWLVRRSIIAALLDLNSSEELFEVCVCGLRGEDVTVQEAAIDALAFFAGKTWEDKALAQLLLMVNSPNPRLSSRVASALDKFPADKVHQY